MEKRYKREKEVIEAVREIIEKDNTSGLIVLKGFSVRIAMLCSEIDWLNNKIEEMSNKPS